MYRPGQRVSTARYTSSAVAPGRSRAWISLPNTGSDRPYRSNQALLTKATPSAAVGIAQGGGQVLGEAHDAAQPELHGRHRQRLVRPEVERLDRHRLPEADGAPDRVDADLVHRQIADRLREVALRHDRGATGRYQAPADGRGDGGRERPAGHRDLHRVEAGDADALDLGQAGDEVPLGGSVVADGAQARPAATAWALVVPGEQSHMLTCG